MMQNIFSILLFKKSEKLNVYYTRGIARKRATNDAHFRDLAPGPHSCEETSQ